jgi:hypothetical protein
MKKKEEKKDMKRGQNFLSVQGKGLQIWYRSRSCAAPWCTESSPVRALRHAGRLAQVPRTPLRGTDEDESET